MFATNIFVTSACSGQSVTSRLRNLTSGHMFVTVNVSFNAYACHEVIFHLHRVVSVWRTMIVYGSGNQAAVKTISSIFFIS